MRIARARFIRSYYENGHIKFREGQHYPLNAETESQIIAGAAEKAEVKTNYFLHLAQLFIASRRLALDRRESFAAERISR